MKKKNPQLSRILEQETQELGQNVRTEGFYAAAGAGVETIAADFCKPALIASFVRIISRADSFAARFSSFVIDLEYAKTVLASVSFSAFTFAESAAIPSKGPLTSSVISPDSSTLYVCHGSEFFSTASRSARRRPSFMRASIFAESFPTRAKTSAEFSAATKSGTALTSVISSIVLRSKIVLVIGDCLIVDIGVYPLEVVSECSTFLALSRPETIIYDIAERVNSKVEKIEKILKVMLSTMFGHGGHFWDGSHVLDHNRTPVATIDHAQNGGNTLKTKGLGQLFQSTPYLPS